MRQEFQSSLAPECERYVSLVRAINISGVFQSSLAPECERYSSYLTKYISKEFVSILARTGVRALPMKENDD